MYGLLQFPHLLQDMPPLEDDKKYVFYDESLFLNFSVKKHQFYIRTKFVHNKLLIIYNKLIFHRLLEKITTENSFQLCSRYFKQKDGCAMVEPLSVTLTDIWMVRKMTVIESDLVIPHKPIFYKRYIERIINCRKKHDKGLLFKKHSNYHPKFK